MAFALSTVVGVALTSCKGDASKTGAEARPTAARNADATAQPAEREDPDAAALLAADEAATALVAKLKGQLMKAMQDGGPSSALEVCTGQGQSLTASVVEDTGVQVGRSSLRLRNPKNAPSDWVEVWLDEHGERKVDGAPPIESFRRVVDTPDGRMARIVRPIVVEPPCLKCHGSPDDLAPGIAEDLAQHYPKDQATGYAVGDLRGALWAQVAVDDIAAAEAGG